MFLLDKTILKGILRIATIILQSYFFYDDDCLERFFKVFSQVMEDEYCNFYDTADPEFKIELQQDLKLKKHFTSYFVSFHLHDVLVQHLHFTDQELDCFENILPKYTGEQHDTKQSNKRAHN